MSIILVDGIKDVMFHNGIVRIECLSAGPNNEQRPSGTLVIPGNVTGPVLQALVNAIQELDKKIRDHVAGQTAKAAETAEAEKAS